MKLTNIYWKRYAGVLSLLLFVGVLAFAVTVFASEPVEMVGSLSCIVTDEGEENVTVEVMVNSGGDVIDSVRMEMVVDSTLSNPVVTRGSDFDTETPGVFLPSGDNFYLVRTHGRSEIIGGAIASEALQFATITFDWTGEPTTITFDQNGSVTGEGTYQSLQGAKDTLDTGSCVIGTTPTLPTIGQIAVTNQLTTLVTALDATNLVDTFTDPTAGPFTVFAPLESAFANLPPGTLDVLSPEALTDILNYHVVSGTLRSNELILLDSLTTLLGEEVTVTPSEDGPILNGSVLIVTTDIEASNGIVHLIDTVLIPPVEATATPIPMATDVPPTATPIPPTATPIPPTATPIPPTATPIPLTATPETVTVVATEVVVSGTVVITGTIFISVTVTPEPTDVPPPTEEPTAVPTVIPDPTVIPGPTLLDLIVDSENHTVLEGLIFDLNLQTLINGLNAGEYTFFAPDDETIQLYLSDAFGLMSQLATQAERNLVSRQEEVNEESIEAEVNQLLRGIILNHIVSGVYDSTTLLDLISTSTMTPTLRTLDGGIISVSIVSDTVSVLLINDLLIEGQAVTVTEADIEATNGILHSVNQAAILPSSVGLNEALISDNGRLLPLFTAVALIAVTSTAIGVVIRRE